MRHTRPILVTVALIGTLLVATGALAAGDVIRRSVVGNAGGEPVKAGGYVLDGTLGETVAGRILVSSGTNYGLGSGFWAGGGVVTVGGRIYLPVVMRD